MGTFVRCDDATKEKTRLGFARVMIDVPFGKPIPEKIKFLDVDGSVICLKVEFEWKPLLCTQCNGIGHDTSQCRKGKTDAPQKKVVQPVGKQQWRPKQKKPVAAPPVVTPPAAEPTAPVSTPVEIPNNFEVNWTRDGKYHVADTPARRIIRYSRQEMVETGLQAIQFGKHNFMESINNVTPKVGVGTNGSALSPMGDNIGLFGLLETKVKPLSLNSATDMGTNTQFHLTMVYAFNGLHERKVLWSKLSQFKDYIQGAWAICGDFNTVLSPNERLGGASSEEEITDFKNCIDDCEVMDCPATGSLFTWCNKHEPATRVYSRLDRVLVNQKWLQDHPQAYAFFYCEGIFDHCPCVVQSKLVGGKKKRSFKYFNMWSKSVDFQQCVKTVWDQNWPGTKMYKLVCKLKHLKGPLKNLNKNDFEGVENNYVRAQMYLEKVQLSLRTDPLNPDLIVQEREAASSVRFLNEACDEFLLQKSKAIWVEKGDCNTKYFHSIIKARQSAFLDFYTSLLGSSAETISVAKNVVQLGKLCTVDHHATLLAPVTKAEIKQVLFSIPPHKAAGPDGYSSAFFRDSWDTVGETVCEAITDFFQHGHLLKQLNHTLVTLIPKCDIPQNVSQFRPISCCNVIYKTISKLICNRLATILPSIISDNQGGFIKGRSIVENILICQDIVRCYNRKSVSPRFMLKVDLKKAYDSVNWEFMKQMLTFLNFPQKFIDLVMECITTASYSLVLNGEVFGHFKGAKGLRQGDPLSPLLFTIAMEYLSRVLNYTTSTMPFKFHPMCSKLQLSHLMFVDDLLLFCKGDVNSIMILLRSFATFSCASGLQMNSNKTNA
ncbi:uncharacterized protein LOC141651471 [Silene latifolia]|uniref:uncharacterized protein LOC141651471 n=1 Tax=Silene latifolia TaxID=37657 RepID=UPI003D774CB1